MTATVETEKDRICRQQFDKLYCQYWQPLFETARRITGNRDDARDVLHSVFLTIILKIVEGEKPEDFMQCAEAFLRQSVTNRAINFVLKRNQENEIHVDVESVQIPARQDPTPSTRTEYVRLAMAKMKPNLVETLELYYFQNLSYKQIARARRKARGTVLCDLYRGRKQVERLILQQEKQDEAKEKDRKRVSGSGLADASAARS